MQRVRRRGSSGWVLGWWVSPTPDGFLIVCDDVIAREPFIESPRHEVLERARQHLDWVTRVSADGVRVGNVRHGGSWTSPDAFSDALRALLS